MSDSEQSGAGQREVAYRIFAAEFDDADYSYSESDEERAPNYVITPTGARANRLFIVGVLTEIEEVSEDVLRARVVDPTGAFVLYAGQYQPDEQAFLERAEPPSFVAVTGKARTFSPDDSDQVFTSIRPESISEVDAETRDRWTVQAAEQTIDRIRWAATALTLDESIRETLVARGADEGLAHGVELAVSHYGTTAAYLDSVYGMAVDAARVVAGEKGEIEGHTAMPDASGAVTPADLLAKLPDDPVGAASGETADEPTAGTAATGAEGEESEAVDEAESAGEGVAAGDSAASADEASGSVESTEGTADAVPEPTDEEPEVTTAAGGDEFDAAGNEGGDEFEADEELDDADGSAEEEGLGDFEPDEEFELESETREEIESEYGTEFKSGTEVEEPGNADIETPDPEESSAAESSEEPVDTESEAEGTASEQSDGEPVEAGGDGEPEPSPDDSAEATPADSSGGETLTDPDDLQAAVVDLMGELDEGNGADREQLLSEMERRHGTDRTAAEEAIQSALMDGECYEPDDSSLKPI